MVRASLSKESRPRLEVLVPPHHIFLPFFLCRSSTAVVYTTFLVLFPHMSIYAQLVLE